MKKNSDTRRRNHDQEVIRAMTDKEIEDFHHKTYEKFIQSARRERKSRKRK